ncbi:MAG TPA: cell division protein CrgA [Acidimicrobiia bacterium]|nr:cell division protein CrgA [Acidimicrobiia bacterium]
MPKSKGRRKPKRVQHPAAPPPKEEKRSPRWYAILMFALMGAGVVVIILNYIGTFPGGTDNNYLYMGLGGIAIGFLMTLWYR